MSCESPARRALMPVSGCESWSDFARTRRMRRTLLAVAMAARRVPPSIRNQVAGDAEEISTEVLIAEIGHFRAEEPAERILNDIVRIGGVAGHPIHVRPQCPRMTAVELAKGKLRELSHVTTRLSREAHGAPDLRSVPSFSRDGTRRRRTAAVRRRSVATPRSRR